MMTEEENIEVTDKFGIMNIFEDSELLKKVPIIAVLADHGCIICLQGFYTIDRKNKKIGLEIKKNSFSVHSVLLKSEKLTIEELCKRLRSWVLMNFSSCEIKGIICLLKKHHSLSEKLIGAILYTIFDIDLGMLTTTMVRNFYKGEAFQKVKASCSIQMDNNFPSKDEDFLVVYLKCTSIF